MALAAADTDSPGAMQTGAADMMSRTFLIVLHLLALIRMTLPPGGGRKQQVNAGLMITGGTFNWILLGYAAAMTQFRDLG
jgi:hypothetical protein